MNIKLVSLMALLGALSGCGAHRAAAPAAPIARPLAGAHALEPLGCPLHAGEDRPDYDAKTLVCIVDWIAQARGYLARGGEPTKYTSPETFERYRAAAQVMTARLSRWLAESTFAPAPSTSVAAPVSRAGLDSQQRFLQGMILFQKGDHEGARREWVSAKSLDPANADVQAALEYLDKPR